MKTYFLLVLGAFLVFTSCNDGQVNGENGDSAALPVIPDSVPQMVRLGKEANWAYKPDTMINEILLGDAVSVKKYKYDNGSKGESADGIAAMHYFNGKETEFLTVFTVEAGGKHIPFGLRLEKNSDTIRNYKLQHNYVTANNFMTSSGVYIGMPLDYVRSIYKSQPMMKWIKGDTTYLEYKPGEKDKQHYHRFLYTEYHATYKFVDDQCRVIEMFVDPKSFDRH